jgi:hypothetical protein
MTPLTAYIDRFTSLGGPKIRIMDRLRISKKELMELRGNLAFYTERLFDFLQVIGLGTVGRVERKVDDVKAYLPELMAKLDQLCAEFRLMGDKESLLSDHPDDEKIVWKTFRTRLINAGFTSRVLIEREASLFLRIRELTKCGLVDSDICSKASPDFDDLETPSPICHFSWQEPISDGDDSHDNESGPESEATITPQSSIKNLRSQRSAA